jgi:hypothetical protein
MLSVHANRFTWPCMVDMSAQPLPGTELWVHVYEMNLCICTYTFTHTQNIKWTLHMYLWEVFVHFTKVVFESDLRCKFMRWRFLQDQKCGWSYSYCGSCLKSKLLICFTGTHKLEGIRHIQIEIPVQFFGDLLVQLLWLIWMLIAICS